jgi:NAD(P)-dependent dehydrogenase (short-subunit alcohol dehydrogenase family)
MSNTLQDRVILVTGAGDGIGAAAAKAFAQEGATVILLGRTPNKLEKTYDEIEALGAPTPAIVPMDLKGANMEEYEKLHETIEHTLGRLDGILHNAGTLGSLTPLSNYDIRQWYDVLQVNLNAPFLLTKALLPSLKLAPDASILFTGDEISQQARAYWGAYGVAKAGIRALTETLADELEANSNIRVNCINPGAVQTKLRRLAFPGEPSSNLVQAEQLMHEYIRLMGPDSKGITGQWIDAKPKESA